MRLLVYGLVYGSYPLHVPPHPLGMPYMTLIRDWEQARKLAYHVSLAVGVLG